MLELEWPRKLPMLHLRLKMVNCSGGWSWLFHKMLPLLRFLTLFEIDYPSKACHNLVSSQKHLLSALFVCFPSNYWSVTSSKVRFCAFLDPTTNEVDDYNFAVICLVSSWFLFGCMYICHHSGASYCDYLVLHSTFSILSFVDNKHDSGWVFMFVSESLHYS